MPSNPSTQQPTAHDAQMRHAHASPAAGPSRSRLPRELIEAAFKVADFRSRQIADRLARNE